MRRVLVLSCVLILASTMAMAGDLSLFGSGWNQNDPGTVYGGGFRLTGQEGPWAADLTISWLDDSAYTWTGWGWVYRNSLQVTPVEIGTRYIADTPNAFRPYAGGGLGYYFISSDFGKVDDKWSGYALVGFNFGNRHTVDFFMEAVYRWLTTNVEVRDPVAGNVTYSADLKGFAFNMGAVIHF
ncbi:MAG: hypothetical protein GXP47_04345 [Acidobacteria bacterium]|nr:hypothetical protein [Acidobacteriota bacterium]